ncbi:MAG: nucleotidyltransferase family protein, partial [Clostridia bacterium]|nr:nucleotidyltransferase family protein [Clostridia bacterium]
MRLAGIISEYNPFHNGHLYHIEQTRKSGATHIVCAMSGNFVQRGDCACADKYIRAKAAVLSGADLVVEIPTPWACSGAENFARGGVSILASLGIDVLSFGCETDELSLLEKTASAVDSPLISQSVRTLVSAGNTYPAALQKSIEAVFGKAAADILSSPNNTLAVEYIRQREKLSAKFELLAVRRKSAGHNDEYLPENCIASASALRKLPQLEKMKNYIPQAMLTELTQAEKSGLFPCLLENADRVILAFLRRMTLEEMKKYISDENGLAERLYSFSRTAQSTAVVIKQVKVKSITEAAVRRAVLSCFLK